MVFLATFFVGVVDGRGLEATIALVVGLGVGFEAAT